MTADESGEMLNAQTMIEDAVEKFGLEKEIALEMYESWDWDESRTATTIAASVVYATSYVTKSGYSQREVAEEFGMSERGIIDYWHDAFQAYKSELRDGGDDD